MRHGKIMEKRSKKKKYLWCQVPSHEVCMSGTPIKIEKKKKKKKKKKEEILPLHSPTGHRQEQEQQHWKESTYTNILTMAPINLTEVLFNITTERLKNVTTKHTTVAKPTILFELIWAYILFLGFVAVFIIISEGFCFPQKQRIVRRRRRVNVQLTAPKTNRQITQRITQRSRST